MEEMILQGLEAILRVLIAVGIIFVVRWLRARLTDSEMELVKEIVMDGVLYAQQVWGHLDSTERYPKALASIAEELTARGIKIDEARLEMFIESAVKMAKADLAEHWEKER